MRGIGRRAAQLLRAHDLPASLQAHLAGVVLVVGVLVGAVVVGDAAVAGDTLDAVLLAGVLGALLSAWGAAGHAAALLPLRVIPAVTARTHRRSRARRAVPRQIDPDAPGRTRSRAPSPGPVLA